jgi:hypothetical protein
MLLTRLNDLQLVEISGQAADAFKLLKMFVKGKGVFSLRDLMIEKLVQVAGGSDLRY